jgi:hypothetical protein
MASFSSSSVSIEETWEPLMGPKLTGGEKVMVDAIPKGV